MTRPAPIIWFERFYLAAFALRLCFSILNWSHIHAGAVEIGVIVALLLWYGVMYQHSDVARWIIILFFVGGTLWTVLLMAAGSYDALGAVILLAAITMNATATALLVSTAAESWFAKRAIDAPAD